MKFYSVKIGFRSQFETAFNSGSYEYLSYFPVENDELVLVETRFGPAIGQVRSCQEGVFTEKASSFLIAKIDLTDFNVLKQHLVEKVKLWQKITRRARDVQTRQSYTELAKVDTELKQLLDEYYGE